MEHAKDIIKKKVLKGWVLSHGSSATGRNLQLHIYEISLITYIVRLGDTGYSMWNNIGEYCGGIVFIIFC